MVLLPIYIANFSPFISGMLVCKSSYEPKERAEESPLLDEEVGSSL